MTWLLISQGLLFTAYGVFLQANPPSRFSNKIDHIITYLPYFGIIISVFFGLGIFAALSAMDQIKKRYYKSQLDENEFPLFSSNLHCFLGRLPSFIVSIFFISIWFCLIFC